MPIPAFAIPSLISLGATGLNYLGASNQQARRRADLQRIMALLSPGSIAGDTNRLFDALRSSPMYSALRARSLSGASALGNAINNRAQRAGLGNSGLATIAGPLAQSSFQQSFNDIDSQLFSHALSNVQANRGLMAQSLLGSPTGSPLDSSIGKGFEFLGPYLRDLMTREQGYTFRGFERPVQGLLNSGLDLTGFTPQPRRIY